MREKRDALTDGELRDVLDAGRDRAREVSEKKMEIVRKAVGVA